MITLQNLCKTFVLNGRVKQVANDISVCFPANKAVAVLGRNGAGKSTLLKMISGALAPDRGKILRQGSVSWPVGYAGSFHQELTGLQNTRFIARVQGVDTQELQDFVEGFAGLGQHYYLPVRSYSSGMRSRLAFGISMGIHFDTYLVDEITAVGDAEFKARSETLFRQRLASSAAIMVTHGLVQAKRLCDHAAVLENGRLEYYEDIDEGIARHQEIMQRGQRK